MATLEQKRAALAFEHVTAVKNDTKIDPKKYGSIVHTMPTLLRSAGLSQALHFVASRKKTDQRLLLDHLAKQLVRVDPSIKDASSMLSVVRKADLSMYLRLTNEALACATWYRRFVQGELGVQAGEGED
jgi:CRISPR type III-B/RAMP module-associated protein Cmr5